MRTALQMTLLLLVLAALGASVAAAAGDAGARYRYAVVPLRGGTAVTPPGDPDGAGRVTICLDTKTNRVGYRFAALRKIDRPISAHIHLGPPGTAGPILVAFPGPPRSGAWAGAVKTTAGPMGVLVAGPKRFYVNVHNAAFVDGALRGQLAGFLAGSDDTMARC